MIATERGALVRALAEASSHLGSVLTQESADYYWRHLSDLPAVAVLGSLDRLVKATDRMPPVSAIRAGCEGASGHSVGSQPPGSIGKVDCPECEGRGFVSVVVQGEGQPVKLARRCQCRRKG